MKKILLLMCVGILFSTSCQARCSKKRPTPTVQTETTTETTTVPTEPSTVPTETTTVPTEASTTPQPEALKCACGRHNNASARFIGGVATHPHEYPSFAALVDRDDRTRVLCSGSVIADQWVLTSVICSYIAPRTSSLVALGGHDLTAEETSRKYFEIESFIGHENFADNFYDNNIMLVKLKEKIEFTDEISPVCLPSESFTDETFDKFGTAVGYGKSKPILEDVNLRILSAERCKQVEDKYGYIATNVQEDNICTSSPDHESCESDYGGPLLVERNGRLTQVGVNHLALVLLAQSCSTPGIPVIYTKTESFVKWMESKMGAELCLN